MHSAFIAKKVKVETETEAKRLLELFRIKDGQITNQLNFSGGNKSYCHQELLI
jgi:hypothetical protein